MSESTRTMLDHAREALSARMLKDDLRLVLENVITYAAERQAENEQLRHDVTGACLARWEEEQENARLRLALESARRGRRELRDQVAALLEERYRTNEWADDAAKALRANRDRIAELETHLAAKVQDAEAAAKGWERARERLAEFERPADEDPIALSLTTKADVFVPRTERQRWQDIADALNAAHAAGMPVGIDLDGTLTDHRMWSVVWDRDAERWTVAGYEDDAEQAEAQCDHPNGYGPNGCAGCGESRPADTEDDVTPQVARLRALLAGQREQAEHARAAHTKYEDSEHCQHDGEPWPCPTVAALGETGGA